MKILVVSQNMLQANIIITSSSVSSTIFKFKKFLFCGGGVSPLIFAGL
jgi:hypothetical protein